MLLSDFLQYVRVGNLDKVIKGIREGVDPSSTNNWPLLLAYSEAESVSRKNNTDISKSPSYEIILYLWQYPAVREKILYLCTDLNDSQRDFILTFPTKITYVREQIEEILGEEEESEEESEGSEDDWLEEGGWTDLEKEYLEAKAQKGIFGF